MTYQVRARNTATTSANRIHDDDVARSLGFRGGLVPGVDVYAHLAHVPAERWGRAWLARGTATVRFTAPVYDGEEITVVAAERDRRTLDLVVRGPAGDDRASGRATLPADPPTEPDPQAWPADPAPAEPPDAAESTLTGRPFGAVRTRFDAAAADAHLTDVGESLPLFRDGPAHPGWLLRRANDVLVANVRLGPWIHVGSRIQHLGVVSRGTEVEARARGVTTSQRGGHRFVDLDVLVLAAGRPVARIAHTAIWLPRELAGSGSGSGAGSARPGG
jgi:hypothetical protein